MTISLVIPTLDAEKARFTATTAIARAGIECEALVVEDNERHGYTRTVNAGLAQAEGDVCILVDDCVPSENWLMVLVEETRKRAALKVWFAGPSGPCRTYPQAGGRPNDGRRPRTVPHLAGFCLYVVREALDALGGLDERYTHYGSDVDLQRRARKFFGAQSLWVPQVYVAHELHPPHAEWWAVDQRLLDQIWNS